MPPPHTPLFRLLAYVAGLAAVALTVEAATRLWQPLFRASAHRSLFKAALLEQHLPQDVIFFGTSRAGESLRPSSFVDELARRGAPGLSAFNVSTPFSSLDILDAVAKRFSTAPGLKLAIIEISNQQLRRKIVPWTPEPPGREDFDARVFAWVEQHSALVAERKGFVLNSLGRLLVVALFGGSVDGTEEFGTDYVKAVFGRHRDSPPSAFDPSADCRPRTPDTPPQALQELAEERELYVAMEKAFSERGVKVVFFVPPTRDPALSEERAPKYRAFAAAIYAATGRPVWDFTDCALPANYYRDPTHHSHLGGSHFSRIVAREVAQDAELSRALGLHALP